MIVHKIWSTVRRGKWDAFYFEGRYYGTRERHWEGYFLLGILPIFIKNTHNIYVTGGY